jgi:hypothetical protein
MTDNILFPLYLSQMEKPELKKRKKFMLSAEESNVFIGRK